MKAVQKAILESDRVGKFNMLETAQCAGLSATKCKTRGCIAGHAAWLFTTLPQARRLVDGFGHLNGWERWISVGAMLLDLPLYEARRLFCGRGFGGVYATAKKAAFAMGELLKRDDVGHYDGPMPTSPKLRALYRRGRA